MPPKKAASKTATAVAKKSDDAKPKTVAKATKSTKSAPAKVTKASTTKTAATKAAATKSAPSKAPTKVSKTATTKTTKAAASKTAASKSATATKSKTATPKAKPAADKAASKKRKASPQQDEDEEDKENAVPVGRPTKRARAVKHEVAEPVEPAGPLNKAPAQVYDVFIFGTGENGELGLGPSKTEAVKPRRVPSMNPGEAGTFRVVDIYPGGMHTVALTKDNKIVTWGVNDNGALGRDTNWDGGLRDMSDGSDDDDSEIGDLNPKESTPTEIPASAFAKDAVFTQVAAGDSISLALTEDGLVYGWGTFTDSKGDKMFGIDEDGNEVDVQHTPALIPGLENIIQISCGANHALALDREGTVFAWGVGEQSQLGRRVASQRQRSKAFQPHAVANLEKKTKYIATGHFHSFAVDNHDNVWSWGLNGFGQTGYAKTAGKDNGAVSTPTKIVTLSGKKVISMGAGANHSVAITSDGKCLVWGSIDAGQLGVKFTDAQVKDSKLIRLDDREKPRICLLPTEVPTIDSATHVGCGTDHTIVLDSEGAAYATGFGTQGQLGLGSYDDIDVFQRIPAKEKKLIWAGCGGQFSIVAAPADS